MILLGGTNTFSTFCLTARTSFRGSHPRKRCIRRISRLPERQRRRNTSALQTAQGVGAALHILEITARVNF